MIGTAAAIGAGMKVGAALWGGHKTSQALRKIGQNLDRRERQNEDWYNMRYNEDMTQRADAQRLWQMTQDAIRNRNKQAAATAAIMGGTNESLAAARAANANALSDAASTIALQGAAQKDAIEKQYMTQRDKIYDAQNALLEKKAQNLQDQASAVAAAGAGMTDAFSDYIDKPKKA